jgi:hypothetical protein
MTETALDQHMALVGRNVVGSADDPGAKTTIRTQCSAIQLRIPVSSQLRADRQAMKTIATIPAMATLADRVAQWPVSLSQLSQLSPN